VNGGLARSEGRRVIPSAGASSERTSRESASPPKTGEDRRKAQGGARASFSGDDIAKSGGVVAGPGLQRPPDPTKGLLPTEGTPGHHGAFRSREAFTVDLRRYGASSDPCTKAKSRGHGESAALAKAREAWGCRRSATGVSEARSHQRRGKKTPTLMTKAVRQPS